MKRYAGLLGALAVLAFVGFYGAVFAAVTAAPAHTIYAPTSAVSGSDFVAAWDATGCGNKPPVVAWTYPAGCTIAGQGQATARFTCIGARGVSIPLSATATAGRPPSTCNGSASTSVVLAGGPSDLPCCPSAGPDGANPSPVAAVVPQTIYYRPGVPSTGKLGLQIGIAVCQECPTP